MYIRPVNKIFGFSLMFLLVISTMGCADNTSRTGYRGFTVTNLNDKTLKDISTEWNGNIVRYMIRPKFLARNNWHCSFNDAWERFIRELPEGLDNAQKYGITVVLDLHGLPNENHKDYPTDRVQRSAAFWNDADNLRIMIKCWQDMAKISANRKQDIWFDIYNEPLDWNDFPEYAKSWPQWAQKVIDAIRVIDKKHPVVVETGPGGLCWGFKNFPMLNGSPIIYSVHQYQPHRYTHQGVGSTKNTDLAQLYLKRQQKWPGEYKDSDGFYEGGMWDKARIAKSFESVRRFQKEHGVRIFVGEFSVVRYAPDAEKYLRDNIELFEEYGWDWAYHAWEESPVWRLDYSDDYSNPKPSEETTSREMVVREFMKKNCENKLKAGK